ncbi:MAG: glycosyltransferase [Marinilabiliaceae bacterium]|jgi:cellulose synthase/poly-beta-1,6-N-acetylglucosamine synthase-like glycosyltransferase|nr:glycosyltransferase [Marinilabiliaceae bacterium]
MIVNTLFWLSLGLLLYTYLLYPVIILGISAFLKSGKAINEEAYFKSVSILLPVHNEENNLRQKLDALLQLNYPEDLIEILIGSDNSGDATNDILNEYSLKYSVIKSYLFNERRGKAAVVNSLAGMANGEILVITDAGVIPEEQSLARMIQAFSDPCTGLVDSNIKIISTGSKRINPERIYQVLEYRIKKAESDAGGLLMGPSGGYYAIRRSLYRDVPANFLVDDFFINMKVLLEGYSSKIETAALAYETETGDRRGIFKRQVRISAGSFQNLAYFPALLVKPWFKAFYVYISHKVLRWLSPFIYLLFLISNILLAGSSEIFRLLFYVQLIFIFLSAIDQVLRKINIRFTPLGIISHFIYMNIAIIVGFGKYVSGIKSGIWEPTKR